MSFSFKIGGGRALGISIVMTALATMLLAGGAGASTFTVDDSGGVDYIEDTGGHQQCNRR